MKISNRLSLPNSVVRLLSDVREPKEGVEAKRRRLPFWDLVERTETCWIWLGAKTKGGYGHTVATTAHRRAYEELVGPIPEGLDLDHLCRVRACVNPAHLEPVTRKVNVNRGEKANRTHCPKGHPYDALNTYYRTSGARVCRACQRGRPR